MAVPDPKRLQVFIERNGEFVPVAPLAASAVPEREWIVCQPRPGRHGVEYAPDWYGLTRYG